MSDSLASSSKQNKKEESDYEDAEDSESDDEHIHDKIKENSLFIERPGRKIRDEKDKQLYLELEIAKEKENIELYEELVEDFEDVFASIVSCLNNINI